jgi:hypothetical protein
MGNQWLPTCMASLVLCLAASSMPALAQQTRVGGYATTSVANKEVADAAAFAITAQAKASTNSAKLELVEILSAESQVVAGVNYRLKLKVKENGSERIAEAVVWWQAWRKPEPYQLTSWTETSALSEEEVGRVLQLIGHGGKVERDTLHRALISSQTYLRASAARLLGEAGDASSVPHLIDALSDQSVHVGANYREPGMATTRYWANESLKKLTKKDFGFVWNAPESERQAAIKRWRDWHASAR